MRPADVLVFESGSNDLRDSMFTPDPAVALERFGVDRDAVLDLNRMKPNRDDLDRSFPFRRRLCRVFRWASPPFLG